MSERAQRVRLGLFVAAALLALGALIILFAKRPEMLSTRDRFFVTFSNAPNLQPGTPVRRSGVKIGEVSRVELTPEGLVEVDVLIDRRYPPRRNEYPAITQSLLTGDATIDLLTDPKEPDRDPVPPRDTDPSRGGTPLKGRGPLDPREFGQGARDLGQSAKDTLDQIQKSIDKFSSVGPQVERTLKEYEELSRAVRGAIPEVQQTNDSVRRLADATRANFPALLDTNDRLKVTLDNWNKAGERVNVILMANEKEFARLVENLSATILAVKQLLGDENQRLVTDLLRNAGQVFGPENQKNVAALLRHANSAFTDQNVRNLNETLRNVRSASESLDRALKDSPATVKRLNETLAKADAAIETVRKFAAPFADDGGEFQRNLTYTAAQLGLLLRDLREVMRGYAGSEGTVQKLLTDPTLYNRASDAVGSFQKLMPKLDLILEDLKDFSDKIARHPNQLIFDKGGGLKGSPFAPTPGSRTSNYPPVTTPPITIGPR